MKDREGKEFEYLYRSVNDALAYALGGGFTIVRHTYSTVAERTDVKGIFELTEMPGKYQRWYWKREGANIPAAR